MLIVNDAHFALAGVASLEERCTYCTKPLAAYPLVLSDDTNQTVYHITCAIQLASDLLAVCLRSSVRLNHFPRCLFSRPSTLHLP